MDSNCKPRYLLRMKKSRLEAFSDGVVAILITIMVLELRIPSGVTFDALQPLLPSFLTYVLSFVFLGIYWNNHHHLLHAADQVNGGILWANLHLLFWLSLIPFVTGWMGENHFMARFSCLPRRWGATSRGRSRRSCTSSPFPWRSWSTGCHTASTFSLR